MTQQPPVYKVDATNLDDITNTLVSDNFTVEVYSVKLKDINVYKMCCIFVIKKVIFR